MKKTVVWLLFTLCTKAILSQSVGIGEQKFTPHQSAALEIRASDKGILIPRLTEAQKNDIVNPTEGLLIYQSDASKGFYYYSNNSWNKIGGESGAVLLELTNNELSANGGAAVNLSDFLDNTDQQQLTNIGDTLFLTNGGYLVLSDILPYQELELSGNNLSISNGNQVNLSRINTDNQQLELSGDTLKLTNSKFVLLPEGVAPQQLFLINDILTISEGNSVDLSSYKTDLDNQTLSISNNMLQILRGNQVSLSPYLDNTDNQHISVRNDSLVITGSTTRVDLSQYRDTAAPQDLSLVDDTLRISGGSTPIDLSVYNNSSTAQNLLLAADLLSITDGNSVDLSGYLDNTDSQNLSLTNDTLYITDGTPVDLSVYRDTVTTQNLLLSGTDLSIDGGNTVSLDTLLDNTDEQDLSISNDTLYISGSSSQIYLGDYMDNTDNQTVSIEDDSLVISGGNSVALSDIATSVGDDLGNHTASENLQLNGFFLNDDGDNNGLTFDTAANANFTDNVTIEENLEVSDTIAAGGSVRIKNAEITSYAYEFTNLSSSEEFIQGISCETAIYDICIIHPSGEFCTFQLFCGYNTNISEYVYTVGQNTIGQPNVNINLDGATYGNFRRFNIVFSNVSDTYRLDVHRFGNNRGRISVPSADSPVSGVSTISFIKRKM